MKRMILAMALGLFACESSTGVDELNPDMEFAQQMEVPVEVEAAFKREYPGIADPVWEKEGADYEAVFKVNNHEASAVFHGDGKLLETETEIDMILLPQAAVDYVNEFAPGSRIAEASKLVNSDGTVNYEVEVDGNDLLFDEKGSFLREL